MPRGSSGGDVRQSRRNQKYPQGTNFITYPEVLRYFYFYINNILIKYLIFFINIKINILIFISHQNINHIKKRIKIT